MTIYVQLLGEGTVVYRPVPAIEVGDNTYLLCGEDIYDPEDEDWEFPPGSIVRVRQCVLEGEDVIVASERMVDSTS